MATRCVMLLKRRGLSQTNMGVRELKNRMGKEDYAMSNQYKIQFFNESHVERFYSLIYCCGSSMRQVSSCSHLSHSCDKQSFSHQPSHHSLSLSLSSSFGRDTRMHQLLYPEDFS